MGLKPELCWSSTFWRNPVLLKAWYYRSPDLTNPEIWSCTALLETALSMKVGETCEVN